MRAFLICLALGLSGTVAAQQTVTGLTLDFGGQPTLTLGPGDCSSQITINWSATPLSQMVCSDIRIWITTGSCGDAPNSPPDWKPLSTPSEMAQANWPTQRSGTVKLNVTDLPIFQSTDGGTTPNCPLLTRATLSVCGSYQYAPPTGFGFPSCSSPTTTRATSPTIVYAGVPPGVPTITRIDPLDSALSVHVIADTNATEIDLRYALHTDGKFKNAPTFTPAQGVEKITGLSVGTDYDIEVRSRDLAGNASDWSPPATATPGYAEGFFDKFQREGGNERGGCSTAAGGTWFWAGGLLLAGFFFARSRRG